MISIFQMRKRRLCALLVVTQLEAMASQVESGLTGVQGNGAQMLNAGEEADYREQGFLNAAPTAAACPPGPRGGAQSWAEGRRKLRGPGRQGLRAPAPPAPALLFWQGGVSSQRMPSGNSSVIFE